MSVAAEETKTDNEIAAALSSNDNAGVPPAHDMGKARNEEERPSFSLNRLAEAKTANFSLKTKDMTPFLVKSKSFKSKDDLLKLCLLLEQKGIKVYNPPHPADDDDMDEGIIQRAVPHFGVKTKTLPNGKPWSLSTIWATQAPSNMQQPQAKMILNSEDHGRITIICDPSLRLGSNPVLNNLAGAQPRIPIGFIKGLPPSFRPDKDMTSLASSLTTLGIMNASDLDMEVMSFSCESHQMPGHNTVTIGMRLPYATEPVVVAELLKCIHNKERPWMWKDKRLDIALGKQIKSPRPTHLDPLIKKWFNALLTGYEISLSEVRSDLHKSDLEEVIRNLTGYQGLHVSDTQPNKHGQGLSVLIHFNSKADAYYATCKLQRLTKDPLLFLPLLPSLRPTPPRVNRVNPDGSQATLVYHAERILSRHLGIGLSYANYTVISPILNDILGKTSSSPKSILSRTAVPGLPHKQTSTVPGTSYASKVMSNNASKTTSNLNAQSRNDDTRMDRMEQALLQLTTAVSSLTADVSKLIASKHIPAETALATAEANLKAADDARSRKAMDTMVITMAAQIKALSKEVEQLTRREHHATTPTPESATATGPRVEVNSPRGDKRTVTERSPSPSRTSSHKRHGSSPYPFDLEGGGGGPGLASTAVTPHPNLTNDDDGRY